MKPKNPLRALELNVTNRCNMRCAHCWPEAGDIFLEDEIPVKEITMTIKNANPLGLKEVTITGGEPLLRAKDVRKIVKYCFANSVKVTMETNAILLTNEIIAEVVKPFVSYIAISLDFLDGSKFDKFRGLKGAYQKVVQNLKLLVANGIKTQVIISVFRDNLHQVKQLTKFALKNLHVNTVKIGPVIPEGRAKTNLDDKILSSWEILSLAKIIGEIAEVYPKRVVCGVPPALIRPTIKCHRMACSYESMLGIFPNGDISICSGFYETDVILGNIRQIPIWKIWITDKRLRNIRRALKELEFKGVCGICRLKRYCKGFCPAFSYRIYGHLGAAYPICQQLYEEHLFPVEMLLHGKHN